MSSQIIGEEVKSRDKRSTNTFDDDDKWMRKFSHLDENATDKADNFIALERQFGAFRA
jgi:hypothetical protein